MPSVIVILRVVAVLNLISRYSAKCTLVNSIFQNNIVNLPKSPRHCNLISTFSNFAMQGNYILPTAATVLAVSRLGLLISEIARERKKRERERQFKLEKETVLTRECRKAEECSFLES